MSKNLTGMSKFVALVLRHKPEEIGIELDDNGWVDVDELVSCASSYQQAKGYEQLTHELLDEIVSTDKKGRYEYSEDGWMIRACQGHSVHVDLELEPEKPPKMLYHGTATRFIKSIKETGLDKRSRTHVHLSKTHDEAVNVGKRHGKVIVLVVRSGEMHDDGYEFFLSKNKIWLIDSVPAKYIDFPEDDVLFEDKK